MWVVLIALAAILGISGLNTAHEQQANLMRENQSLHARVDTLSQHQTPQIKTLDGVEITNLSDDNNASNQEGQA